MEFKLKKITWLVLVIPNILSVGYFLAVAANQYVSRSTVLVLQSVQSQKESGSITNDAPIYFRDGSILKSALNSWDVEQSVARITPLAKWSSSGPDFITRFGGVFDLFQKNEVLLWKYYRSSMSCNVSKNDGLLEVSYTSNHAGESYAILKSALDSAENKMNALSIKKNKLLLALWRGQVHTETSALKQVESTLVIYQKNNGIYDPKTHYQIIQRLRSSIRLDIAKLEARETAMNGQIKNNPDIAGIRSAISSMDLQSKNLQQQSLRGTSATMYQLETDRKQISKLLYMDKDQEQNAYMKVSTPTYLFSYVSAPSITHAPAGPNRILDILTVLAITTLLWVFLK